MDHLSNCTCKCVQVCASMCKCVYYCCDGSSLCTQGFYLLRQEVQLQVTSHGQNIFAETPMLLSSLACASQCSCACGSYKRCRAQCVCIRAPTGHRPSVYERIRWGDPPPPPVPGASVSHRGCLGYRRHSFLVACPKTPSLL